MQLNKEEFFNKGYFVGNIFDFLSNEKINELKSLIPIIKETALDTNNLETTFDYSISGPDEKYDSRIPYNEISNRKQFVKDSNRFTFQMWHSIKNNTLPNKIYSIAENIIREILNNWYNEYNITSNEVEVNPQFTYYDDGCFINDHEDGANTGRLCVILMYMNDDRYDESFGAQLKIHNKNETPIIVEPVFGNFAILDFVKHNVSHEVLMVKNGYKRFNCLAFCRAYPDTNSFELYTKNHNQNG